MAKMNKWGEILSSLSSSLKGKTRKRTKNTDPFDIFPSWFKSIFSKKSERKDKETVEEKDRLNTYDLNNYLGRKKAVPGSAEQFKKDQQIARQLQSKFSSPDESQEIAEPTNMGEYGELEGMWKGISYSDPVISTKPTPTSEKLGVPRPGPSTFIQTARYNPETKRLNVQYTDGTIFPYQNVSLELADRILNKKAYHSPGQEMLNTIFYGHGTTRADQIDDIEEGM